MQGHVPHRHATLYSKHASCKACWVVLVTVCTPTEKAVLSLCGAPGLLGELSQSCLPGCFPSCFQSPFICLSKKATKLNFGACLYRNAIILVLSNGFSIGCIVAVFLHLLLPFDAVDNVDADSASKVADHVNPREAEDLTHHKVCHMRPISSSRLALPYTAGVCICHLNEDR